MSKPKTKQPLPPESNTFYCCACASKHEGVSEFKKHLSDVHKITELKGTRKGLTHMDGADWYSWEFELEIGGLKFVQSTFSHRHKNDPMRFA